MIEPLAEHAQAIRENYSSAGIEYTLLPCAASNFSGPTQLEVINPAKPYSSQLLNNTLTQCEANLRDINAITLDEVMQSHTAPFLIKIDVDGQEKLVLEGLNHTDDVAAVVIEASLTRLPETVEILESKGLKLFDIVDPCYRGAYLQQVDLVFTNGNSNRWLPERSKAELRALPYSSFTEDQVFKDEKRRKVLLGIHKGIYDVADQDIPEKRSG